MIPAALKAAAILADPSTGRARDALPDRAAEPAEIVAILQRNKVPLLHVDPEPDGLAVSDTWRSAVGLETAQKRALLDEYLQIERSLQSAGIAPVLFKSPRGLPYRSSNLDLLVRPSEMSRAADLLEQAGHIRLPHYREEHKLLYRRFRGGRSVICVHLHDAVSWGRVMFLEGDGVIERSRPSPDGEGRIASPADLILTTLAHSLYETDQIRLADLRAIRGASADPDLDWKVALARVRERGWSVGFSSILLIVESLERTLYGASQLPAEIVRGARECVDGAFWARRYVRRAVARLGAAEAPETPLPISKVYSKIHYTARLLTESSRSPDERVVNLIATVSALAANRLRLRCRPAAVVSLSGIDGAGKSAVGQVLLEALSLCEVPVRGIWSRGGFSGPVEAVKRASRAALPRAMPAPTDPVEKRRWLAGRAAGTSFAMLVCAEQVIAHALRVLLPRVAGITLVCDRYAYDTAADVEVKTGGRNRLAGLAARALTGFVRKPDLAILLRLTAAEAIRRKPEEDGSRLARHAEVLERLAREHALVEIDAALPRDLVAEEVVDRALRAVFARWR